MSVRKVYGVGINDSLEPICTTKNGKTTLKVCYRVWTGFLERCYSSSGKYPQYVGCTVHEDWHNYSRFKKWFEDNYKDGYVLDKDMKVLGNKVYGPYTCVFVPAWLNTFLNPNSKRRGSNKIGVSKCSRGFKATVSENGKSVHLGYYLTEEEAHISWRKYKLGILEKNKSFIETLSPEIYHNLVASIKSFI